MGIKFFTDSTADLPAEYLKEHDIGLVLMRYLLDDEEHPVSPFEGEEGAMPVSAFYDAMRAGSLPTTSQINEMTYWDAFEPILANGDDVFYIAFSSGLTGQLNNALRAKDALEEKYPGRTIFIVDSLSASLGEGLLVMMAVREYESGKCPEDIQAILEEARAHVHHWFMVEELNCLKRGGRVSAATAAVGTLLNVKPILYIDEEGHLVASEKAQGRKRAMKTLLSRLAEKCEDDYSAPVCLVHADADEADVERLRAMTEEQIGREVDLIANLSPIVGAHTGPGLLALIFIAPSER